MILQEIETLPKLKPLSVDTVPSVIDVILLCSNLLSQSNSLINGTGADNKIEAKKCTSEVMKLKSRICNYDTRYLTVDEVVAIRKKHKV